MKVWGLFLLSFLGVSCMIHAEDNANALLRRKRVKPRPDDHPDKHVFMGTFITLAHVHEEHKPNVNATLMEDCFIQAFSKISHNGYTINSGFVSKSFMVPEDDNGNKGNDNDNDTYDPYHDASSDDPGTIHGIHNGRWNPFAGYSSRMFISYWDASCRFCNDLYDDDVFAADAAALGRNLLQDGNAHKALEAEFCNELRQSGDPMLAELKHCYIEFTYSATHALSESDVTATAAVEPTSRTMRCHLDIDHVTGSSFSPADLDIVGDIVRNSYNLIHAGLGYRITGVELERRLDFPESPDETGPDDLFNRIWFMKADYKCVNCKRLPPMHLEDRGLHKAFEDLVCLQLQTSGLRAYRKASDCEISFVFGDPNEIFAMTL